MCKAKTIELDDAAKMGVADPTTEAGQFIVIRDVDIADLHVKGSYASLEEAQARAAEFGKAGIMFVPATPKGSISTGSGSGRKVVNMNVTKVVASAPVLTW